MAPFSDGESDKGLGEKLKLLARQAQETVAEHREQIHGAVDAVSVVADRQTQGKYTERIQKLSRRAADAVDKLGGRESPGGDSPEPRGGAPEPRA
ncbi:MAG: antitoxin [Solirubrobacteraceae bacterium]